MTKPTLTLILACSSVPAQVRTALDRIAAQQPVEQVELILVAWEGRDYRSLGGAFHSVQQITFPENRGLNEPRLEAVRRATTPIVVFLEDHAEVLGDWVRDLPEIFAAQKCAAVGWTTLPGGRESRNSWAGYLSEYGLWGPGTVEGETRDHLPGHNTAYERAALLAYENELGSLLRAESLLHWRFVQDGRPLYFTERFVLRHTQFQRLRNLYWANFWYGWNFGDARRQARRWGPLTRLLYAGGIFLKPAIRWKILLGRRRDASAYPSGILGRTWWIISITFLIGAVGEAFGYLCGTGRAPARLSHYELGYDRSEA